MPRNTNVAGWNRVWKREKVKKKVPKGKSRLFVVHQNSRVTKNGGEGVDNCDNRPEPID